MILNLSFRYVIIFNIQNISFVVHNPLILVKDILMMYLNFEVYDRKIALHIQPNKINKKFINIHSLNF